MKQKHLYSLLDTSFSTINVVFPRDEAAAEAGNAAVRKRFNDDSLANNAPRTFVYKAPKSADVSEGDHVIVNTARGLVVVKVASVDDTPQIDVDADYDYKWIVQKVDLAAYDARVQREGNFVNVMRDVERVRQREALVADMREHLPEGSEARRLFDSATRQLQSAAAAAPMSATQAPEAPCGGKLGGEEQA
jgi:D-alanyl-D-alanine carboxypeptidase